MLEEAKNKIRKLMNLAADDAATEGEINNALEFARRLALRHNIDESELDPSKTCHEVAADAEYDQMKSYSHFVRLTRWESYLSQAIAELVGTIGAYVAGQEYAKTPHGTVEFDKKGQPKKRTAVAFYGPVADVQDALELYDEWRTTIIAMARMRYSTAVRHEGRSYAEGFSSELFRKVKKLAKQNPQQLQDSECTALAVSNGLSLMKAKKKEAKEWLSREKGVKLRSRGGGPGGEFHGEAFSQGRRDGAAANFSRDVTRKIGS